MFQSFENAANDALGPGRLAVDVPLAPFTTFRVGGAADWLAEVRSVDELRSLLVIARASSVPVTVLGGGSNVIVSDDGVRGLVVRLLLTGISQPDEATVRAEAGVTINGLVRWTIGRGSGGPRGLGRNAGHGRWRDLRQRALARPQHGRPRDPGSSGDSCG